MICPECGNANASPYMCVECGWYATDDDPPAPPDELLGPTLEVRITTTYYPRAAAYYELVGQAMEASEQTGGEVRMMVDWNGINARPWDMSFVPMTRMP